MKYLKIRINQIFKIVFSVVGVDIFTETIAKKARYDNIPRLLDGKYFEIVKRDDIKVEAVCKSCGKIRKGNLTSTGNFMEHIKKSHPELVVKAELHKKGDKAVEKDKQQKTIHQMMKKYTHEEVIVQDFFYTEITVCSEIYFYL